MSTGTPSAPFPVMTDSRSVTVGGVTIHVWPDTDGLWWAYVAGRKFGPSSEETVVLQQAEDYALAQGEQDGDGAE